MLENIVCSNGNIWFNDNHSIAYCILGYFCAYLRKYHPIEFITALLNNAANDKDIQDGTKLAKIYGIKVDNPKFGISKGDYFYDKEKMAIAKGLSSVKYMGSTVANELYELSMSKQGGYESFVDLLNDINLKTHVDARQIEILIKIEYFSDFGNQKELFTIYDLFTKNFKKGDVKQLKRETVDLSIFANVIKKYSTSKTKSGLEAKNYTILDCMQMSRECEKIILNKHMDDISMIVRCRNFADIMGYMGYITNKQEDRNKLYIRDVYPVKRKRDGKLFAYNVLTISLGSGIESSMSVFSSRFDKDPIKKGDFVKCLKWSKDGSYFRMNEYEHIYI